MIGPRDPESGSARQPDAPAGDQRAADKMAVDKQAKRGRDVRVRLLVTPIILGVIAGVLAIQHVTGSAVGSHLVLALFGALAGAEFALLFRATRGVGQPAFAAVGCALLGAVGLLELAGLGTTMAARSVLLFLLLLALLVNHLRDTRPQAVDSIALGCLPIIYVGFTFSFMAEFAHDWRWLAVIVLTAKASDMAGWAVGVPFGKHKMIPSVSPGKSWEGTFAGLAASALVAVFLPPALGLQGVADSAFARAGFGLLLGAASILAGVTWSGWKRRLGAKDSSALIPEMGGVMDMVDSLLLAGPAAYVWVRLVV